MFGIWKRRPSPAMVVALIALFAALTGSAVALKGHNKVKSDDIKNGQVKTVDIAKRAITPGREHAVTSYLVAGAGATASTTPVDLGGPSVKVSVPPGAMVAIYAKAQLSVTGSNHAKVGLFEPKLLAAAPTVMQSNSNTLLEKFTAPGTGDGDGVTGDTRAGWIVLSPPSGTYTFSLRYSVDGGNGTFAQRKLYVSVIS